jgi:hypothetical protein
MIMTTFEMPNVGEKLVMMGAGGIKLNAILLVAVPPGVVTVITPLCAPTGTVTLILPSLLTVNEAFTPPIVTRVAPVKFVPWIIMALFALPEVGEKLVIVGTGTGTTTVNVVLLVAVPPGVVTAIAPLCAPTGIVTLSEPSARL